MGKDRKEYRKLTVGRTGNYASEGAPALQLQGKWMGELGFSIGDPVIVKCEDEKLIITMDRERTERLAEERDRMKEEQRRAREELMRKNEKRLMRRRRKIYEGFSEEEKRIYDRVSE